MTQAMDDRQQHTCRQDRGQHQRVVCLQVTSLAEAITPGMSIGFMSVRTPGWTPEHGPTGAVMYQDSG